MLGELLQKERNYSVGLVGIRSGSRQELPRISYLTLLDTYILLSFAFLALVGGQNAFSALYSQVRMSQSNKPNSFESFFSNSVTLGGVCDNVNTRTTTGGELPRGEFYISLKYLVYNPEPPPCRHYIALV